MLFLESFQTRKEGLKPAGKAQRITMEHTEAQAKKMTVCGDIACVRESVGVCHLLKLSPYIGG